MVNKNNDDKNSKYHQIAIWIIILLMFGIPFIISIVVYKILMVVFPSLFFTAADLVKLYAITIVLTIGTAMIVTVNKNK